eukprot:TRINITY_DN110512_c0_g1_i1.p1 TRINITY_DN110512_c0_g1~~TRINITY_DN110512_c0_g1_i1.p1  ORF type:complete len:569 (-),score=100.83 TRINITY_DN110512_c0_g1_i1:51-1757(-)
MSQVRGDSGEDAKRRQHEDEKDEVTEIASYHSCNFRYNRRLACFSNAVSCITFSGDGQYLVSGTGSGDVKVWYTSRWAEAAKLRGSRREEPRALVFSPAQRWLVACYNSVLHIFQCCPPWKLEQALPVAGVNSDMSKEPAVPGKEPTAEWCCVAFSPMSEVDHPAGHAGQDNHLAAFSTTTLCVLDYSGGWGKDFASVPRRTRSLMQSARPTSLAYTACGWWIIGGFGDGQLQMWNAFSLTLEKTLSGHTAAVNSVSASPRAAAYESRFVSCGKDQTLRVWHSSSWQLEQHVHELRCDRTGVRHCTFSCTGKWLVSVAMELTVWRVCITPRARMILQLHQRLEAVCGTEGLRTAAFCGHDDAIAAGSQDGVLGLWTKYDGLPPDIAGETRPMTSKKGSGETGSPYQDEGGLSALPRPMQRITPQGVKPLPKPGQPRGEWFQRTHMRQLSMASVGGRTGPSAGLTLGRLSLSPTLPASGSEGDLTDASRGNRRAMTMMPSWKAACLDDVFSQMSGQEHNKGIESLQASRQPSEEKMSPVRKSMLRACRGPVQRICLAPEIVAGLKEEEE